MCKEEMTVIFRHSTFGPSLALQEIQPVLARHDFPLTGFSLYGEPVGLPAAMSQIKESNRHSFNLTGLGYQFHYGSLPNEQMDLLAIESEQPAIPWDEWMWQFMNHSNFVMAWVTDSEYDHWQNAQDPLEYTAVGKSYSHLRLKSNGLPYPVEQQIVDTSANPGRRRFRDGYIEAIGAVMWLGEPFWSLTGADEPEVAAAPWLRVSKPIPSVTKLQVGEQSFTSAEGECGELQRKLRDLLYPRQTVRD